MSISIQDSFAPAKAVPIDKRILLTKTEMLNINDSRLPLYYFALCSEDGEFYLYNKSATPNTTTGKFSLFKASFGSTSLKITSNNATVVEATFKTMITKTGIYTFMGTKVDGNWIWKLDNIVVDLEDYGITYTGTAVTTDYIIIDFTDDNTLVV